MRLLLSIYKSLIFFFGTFDFCDFVANVVDFAAVLELVEDVGRSLKYRRVLTLWFLLAIIVGS